MWQNNFLRSEKNRFWRVGRECGMLKRPWEVPFGYKDDGAWEEGKWIKSREAKG